MAYGKNRLEYQINYHEGESMDDVVIELQNVKKIYKMDGIETPALGGVNLKIKKQEFIAIMGPSGSGKSTLLHMVGALDKPTFGRIILAGVDISTLKESALARLRGKKIGFIFQFFNLHPTLTALENVELPMIIIERNKEERRKKSLDLFARALANNPEIILADEPTGNLDTKTEAEIMKFLLSLQKEKQMTVAVITHENEIAEYAERIVRLIDGKIAE
jgi:putative ABC transport system ATP-binding protein